MCIRDRAKAEQATPIVDEVNDLKQQIKALEKEKSVLEKAASASTASTTKGSSKSTAKTSSKKKASGKTSDKDDLKKIFGIGKVFEKRLHDAGITRFSQIAKWSSKQVAEYETKLNAPRIDEDDWVGQAKKLAGN